MAGYGGTYFSGDLWVIFGNPGHWRSTFGSRIQREKEQRTTAWHIVKRRPVRKATGDLHHVRVPRRAMQCWRNPLVFDGDFCWNMLELLVIWWLFDGYLMVIWWLTALMGQHCCMGFTGPVVQPVALAEGELGSTDTQSHTYHWKILAREPNIQPQKHMVMLLAVQR